MPGRSNGCAAHHTFPFRRRCLNHHQLSSWANMKEKNWLTGFLKSISIRQGSSTSTHTRAERAKATGNTVQVVTAQRRQRICQHLSKLFLWSWDRMWGSCPASALPQQSPTHAPSLWLIFTLPNKHREKMEFNHHLHTSHFP